MGDSYRTMRSIYYSVLRFVFVQTPATKNEYQMFILWRARSTKSPPFNATAQLHCPYMSVSTAVVEAYMHHRASAVVQGRWEVS